MNSRILYFYLAAYIFFADTYFILSWLRPITLLNYVILFYYLISKKDKLPSVVKSLRNLFYLFTIFVVMVDLYQNDFIKALSTLLVYLPIPIVFISIYCSKDNNKLIYFYAKYYILYNGFFALLQFLGIYVTAGELLANFPLLDVDFGFAKEFGNQGLRVSGASYSIIGLACNVGVLLCYFYYNKTILYSKKTRNTYLIVLVILMLFTQTRSVIMSIIPVIFITNNLVSEKKIKTLFKTSMGLLLFFIVLILIIPVLQEYFPRLFLSFEEDGSVVHRIQANVYGVVGTFYLSPLIGIPFNDALYAMTYGYNKIGLFIGYRFIDEVTQHNQPAYFFRYYGFVGFTLFFMIYKKFYSIGVQNFNSINKQKIVVSVIIFHLLYTFSHNNKFTMDFYFWFFMALNSIHSINNTNEQKT